MLIFHIFPWWIPSSIDFNACRTDIHWIILRKSFHTPTLNLCAMSLAHYVLYFCMYMSLQHKGKFIFYLLLLLYVCCVYVYGGIHVAFVHTWQSGWLGGVSSVLNQGIKLTSPDLYNTSWVSPLSNKHLSHFLTPLGENFFREQAELGWGMWFSW